MFPPLRTPCALLRLLTAALIASAAGGALAQAVPSAPSASSATPRARPPAATGVLEGPGAAASAAEAESRRSGLQRTVIEDDNLRIIETRLRGLPQNITVQSKLPGVKPYQILVGPNGANPAPDGGTAGRRAWSVLDF